VEKIGLPLALRGGNGEKPGEERPQDMQELMEGFEAEEEEEGPVMPEEEKPEP